MVNLLPLWQPDKQNQFSKGAGMYSRNMIYMFLIVLANQGIARSEENSKMFDAYHCRYTLPGKGWTWHDSSEAPQAICVARNDEGLVLILSVSPDPSGEVIDDAFVKGYDSTCYASNSTRKRGGRITTFKNLTCYESEGIINDSFTSLTRVVLANGFCYQLQLFGDAAPVEKRPDFETIMNGLEFTSPPVAKLAPSDNRRDNISYRMGQVTGCCLVIALILLVARKFFGGAKTGNKADGSL